MTRTHTSCDRTRPSTLQRREASQQCRRHAARDWHLNSDSRTDELGVHESCVRKCQAKMMQTRVTACAIV